MGGTSGEGICFRRLKLNGDQIIIDPPENPYNLPQTYVTNAAVESIDLFGLKGTPDNPGIGPLISFADYRDWGVTGYNLRTGVEFPVSNYFSLSRGWVNSNTRNAVIVYTDENASIPQTKSSLIGLIGVTNATRPEKNSALVASKLKERPIPDYCGDEGTNFYEGDFNRDCSVDLEDLVILANNWLRGDCSLNNSFCNETDVNKDGEVDSDDYLKWWSELGDISFGEPAHINIEPPLVEPNIIATNELSTYFSEYPAERSAQEGYVAPLAKETLITYKFDDRSFGNLNIDSVEIPVRNIESANPYLEYRVYDLVTSGDVGAGWNTALNPSLIYSTENPNEKLNSGKQAIFNILTSARGYQIKPVILHSPQEDILYDMKVPLEQTLRSDINRDGIINLVDAEYLLSNWLGKGLGDLNEDDVVNLNDFGIFSSEYNLSEDWTGENYIPF